MLIVNSSPLSGRSGHEAGRDLLARMVREYTGEEPPAILVSPRGKPYFAEGSLYFSISHTKTAVFCALSDAPVGIDAECCDRSVAPSLFPKVLSAAEQLRCRESGDPQAAFLRLWVLKEAAAKLSGEGLRGYPNHTDFSPDDPRITLRDGCYVAIMQEEHHAF